MKISLILGIYNAERTLNECLESIFNQNYSKRDYEVIIIDGGSTDSTLKIVNDFKKKNKNLKLLNNPGKLSEGKGMSKDIGVRNAKGNIVAFIDHDNIMLGNEWIKEILIPFSDKAVQASQSMLSYRKEDSLFLKYINSIGVEDPFAVPYSLIAQVVTNPDRFDYNKKGYFTFNLNEKEALFGGANGCAFRKNVFDKIGGYTRDVDIFYKMSQLKMEVAIPVRAKIHHKTSSDSLNYLKKKGIYFYRFITNDYKIKEFSWTSRGSGASGKIRFFIMVISNLTLIAPLLFAIKQFSKKGEFFWFLHPFYLFYITLEYGAITLFRFRSVFWKLNDSK